MKYIKCLLVAALTLAFSSCAGLFRDELAEIHKEIDELKTGVDKLNQSISALQVIVNEIQNGGYVKTTTEIIEGGKVVGYTLLFSDGRLLNIYNGKDGQDGVDGTSPVIGVAKFKDDNVYYWTLNGDWLRDEHGNMIRAEGIQGAPGEPGAPGAQGEDGVTPQFKIENGNWYLSVDNCETWLYYGQATGDQGAAGKDGKDGDSMFKNIDTSNPDYIIITLADGKTTIKLPTWSAFNTLKLKVDAINNSITSLQTLVSQIQKNVFVKSVDNIVEGGVVIGYVITFSDNTKISIYNGKDGQDGKDGIDGKDGKDGKDGQDGKTPVISVAKYVDGKYYWTIDGKWMVDAGGNMVPATGADGAAGADGQDGKDGKDGVTPQLDVREDGQLLVSLCNMQHADGPISEKLFPPPIMMRDTTSLVPFF